MHHPLRPDRMFRAGSERMDGSAAGAASFTAVVLLVVAGLLAQSFNPPRTLTRPFSSPAQRPLEEEPHEESSGHGKLGQTAGSSPGGSRRSTAGRGIAVIPQGAAKAIAVGLNRADTRPFSAEIAGRNGIGAPLRC